jgi:formyltetrahydrofolate synthetase
MPSSSPADQLRELYREGLTSCGFDQAAVERGMRMLESGEYYGFADVVVSMRTFGRSPTVERAHRVDSVIQHVTAQEARVAVTSRGKGSAVDVAARRVEESAKHKDELERLRRETQTMHWLLEQMTADEYEGRVALRPHIAEQLNALDTASRLSLTRADTAATPAARTTSTSRPVTPSARALSEADKSVPINGL